MSIKGFKLNGTTQKYDYNSLDNLPTLPTDIEDITDLSTILDNKAPIIHETLSGAVVSFTDGVDDVPVKSLVVNLEPIQEGEGDSSPENVRPISGKSSVNIYCAGNDIFSSLTMGSGYYATDGTPTSSAQLIRCATFIPVSSENMFTLRMDLVGTTTTARLRVHEYDENQAWIRQSYQTSGLASGIYTFRIPVSSDAKYLRFSLPIYNALNVFINSTDVSVDFGTTVYGGTPDVVSGKLVVDKKGVSLDDPSKWTQTSEGVFTYALSASDRAIYSDSYYGLICSHYTANYSLPQYCRWSSANSGNFRISDSNATLEGLQALSQSGELKIVYNLAEPVEYQLSANEIRTLIGENNIWSDGGNVDVTYLADTKKYIDNNDITDVQINGASIVSDRVANVPVASSTNLGAIKVNGSGVQMVGDRLAILPATSAQVKDGTASYAPIGPSLQNAASFYGLAKAAGDTTQSSSSNAVGTYTDEAKAAIKSMLGVEKTVEVTGQTPTITAEENTRYICGEVTSLTFTPCASGICDVRFTAASISTVLTLPSTLKLPDWFDPTALEANVTYEINVLDGIYGAVMSWA